MKFATRVRQSNAIQINHLQFSVCVHVYFLDSRRSKPFWSIPFLSFASPHEWHECTVVVKVIILFATIVKSTISPLVLFQFNPFYFFRSKFYLEAQNCILKSIACSDFDHSNNFTLKYFYTEQFWIYRSIAVSVSEKCVSKSCLLFESLTLSLLICLSCRSEQSSWNHHSIKYKFENTLT